MKFSISKVFLTVVLSGFFISAFAQIKMEKDTVYCDLYPVDRTEYYANTINEGAASVDFRYELISENVTTLTNWGIEFCDCKECLIGLIDTGSCTLGGSESFKFKYYITIPADFTEYTETYVSYKVTSKIDPTNVDTFTFVTRKADDAPEVSVNDLNQEVNTINIYPNPSEGIVHVSFNGTSKEFYNVSVMNVLGELVYSNILESNATNNNVESQLDLRDLQKGAYFVTISNGQAIKTERLTIK